MEKTQEKTQEKTAQTLPYPVSKIIEVANELACTGRTAASTGEHIAGAFVLNRMDLLPASYTDVVDAWDRLDEWQRYVHIIKANYTHLIVPW